MRTVPFQQPAQIAAAVPLAVKHLRGGGVLAHPTETVYGFGTTLDPDALRALARLKQRDPDKPFLLLVGALDDAPGLEWTEGARALAAAFWPGPLTLALPTCGGAYPAAVVSRAGTVAIRATSQPGMRAVLHALRAPITSSSANVAGEPPAQSAAAVRAALDAAHIEDEFEVLCLDAGPLPDAAPSTIVEFGAGRPRLARAGAIALADLRAVVEEIDG